MSNPTLTASTEACLQWLRRSILVTGRNGSAHSYSCVWGWRKAYPETTGYIVETLFDYAAWRQDISLRLLAFDCLDWLLSQQLPSGAFPALFAGSGKPSVFNTSQILFGLARGVEEAADGKPYRLALEKAVHWLISILETDGSWRQASYIADFTPSYYTRSVWGILRANALIKSAKLTETMRHSMEFYRTRTRPNAAIQHWGFRPGKAAFTHTIAYTIRGFWETGLVLQDERLMRTATDSMAQLLEIRAKKGKTAGRYSEDWSADYSFRCLTGNAQLSIICSRMYAHHGLRQYAEAARSLLEEIIPFQCKSRLLDMQGAFPGSAPVWGPYMRFSYPNWGAKFFLDAAGLIHQNNL